MESLIAVAVVSGATVFSVGFALLLEAVLLRVILGFVAKAAVEATESAERVPAASPKVLYRELRSSAR